MTIYLYSGTPGTGKSLDAARECRFQLNRANPRPVIGNFPINGEVVRHPEMFHYWPNWQITPDRVTDFADRYWDSVDFFKEDYLTIVLDECQLLFNSREWSKRDRMGWLEFFSQHRKYGYKVLFIAQSSKMVDNQFRMLIEYEVKHRKMSNAGFAGWLMSLPFMGRLFVKVLYFYQMNERLSSEWFIPSRKDMMLYDTNARFVRNDVEVPVIGPDPSTFEVV